MMSLALQLGNIVDTIFVSNLIGVEAMSAVTMSLPVETIVQLTGYCLGVGGSIAAGNMLGKRDKEGASRLFSATFIVQSFSEMMPCFASMAACTPLPRISCAIMRWSNRMEELKSFTRESTALEKRPFQSCSAIILSFTDRRLAETPSVTFGDTSLKEGGLGSAESFTSSPEAPSLRELANPSGFDGRSFCRSFYFF